MTINLYLRLKELLPEAPVKTGQILANNADGTARIQIDGAGTLNARNPLQIQAGRSAFIRGLEITGEAPDLPYVRIEI